MAQQARKLNLARERWSSRLNCLLRWKWLRKKRGSGRRQTREPYGEVSIFGPNELHVYARRGQLQLLYRGETETIAEGESYRVILDPSDDPAKKKRAVKGARERKTFLLLATTGAVAGAAAAAALHENHGHKKMESPDRP